MMDRLERGSSISRGVFAVFVSALVFVLGAAPCQASTQFDSFSVKKWKYKPPRKALRQNPRLKDLFKTKFMAKGEFELGGGSDGLDFENDEIRVSIGPFVQTIDPQDVSFDTTKGKGGFKGKGANTLKKVKFKRIATGRFEYLIKGRKMALAQPGLLTLQIGDDLGQIDLATGTMQTPTAVVSGMVVASDPLEAVVGVTVEIACPAGTCTAVTGRRGTFTLDASLGSQELVLDGRTASGGPFPRIRPRIDVQAGANDAGSFEMPVLDEASGTSVAEGVQATPVTITSSPVSTGGTVSLDIAAAATVTYPAWLASPQTISVTEVSPTQMPMPFPTDSGGPLVVTLQPSGTAISPCADLLVSNPFSGLSDGETVDLYGTDHVTGEFAVVGTGTVQNSATEIFAPGAVCTFSWFFWSTPGPSNMYHNVLATFYHYQVRRPRYELVNGARVTFLGKQYTTRRFRLYEDPIIPLPPGGPGLPRNFASGIVWVGTTANPLWLRARASLALPAGILVGSTRSLQASSMCSGCLFELGWAEMRLDQTGRYVEEFPFGPLWSWWHPGGIAIDTAGNIYTTDRIRDQVHKFGPEGNWLLSWGTTGVGDGEFDLPGEIAIGPLGEVYVLDKFNHRIQKFDSDGNFVLAWSDGTGFTGPINVPQAITVGPSGDVYVAVWNSIKKFDANGNFLLQWAVGPSARGLAADSGGNIYVSDLLENTVTKSDADGGLLVGWGAPGRAAGLFRGAADVAVDPSDHVYVLDTGNNRVQAFDAQGGFILQWGGGPGDDPGEFGWTPGVIWGGTMAADASGNVYVSDYRNDRVQKFVGF